jgi:antitoxin (DNA-binding transcriptional repressor) of toxin-antitoxin stability system
MATFGIHQAKTNLSKLIARVEAGGDHHRTRQGPGGAPDGDRPEEAATDTWTSERTRPHSRQFLF